MLRHLGCQLPVELWHLGPHEMDARMEELIGAYGVQCQDASKMRRQFPVRLLGGWQLKPYAILYSAFRQVLLLDADNVCVVNPEFLFETPEFAHTGAIFWPDYAHRDGGKSGRVWKSCGLRRPAEPEFESGQIVVDKQRCWPALRLSLWFNENSDFYYQFLHGDKETFHLGFRKTRQPYALVPTPIHTLPGVMCQHDFQGHRIFQHRNMNKWSLASENRRIPDFWFENECRQFLTQLKQLWDGTIHKKSQASVTPIAAPARTQLAINDLNQAGCPKAPAAISSFRNGVPL
jgi:hypothetical protein